MVVGDSNVDKIKMVGKRGVACISCHARHIKCSGDGENPCEECIVSGREEECSYAERKRSGPPRGWSSERERMCLELCHQVDEAQRELVEERKKLTSLQQELDEAQKELADERKKRAKTEDNMQMMVAYYKDALRKQSMKRGCDMVFTDESGPPEFGLSLGGAMEAAAELLPVIPVLSSPSLMRKRRPR